MTCITSSKINMGMKVNDKIYKRRIKRLKRFVKNTLPKMALKEFKKQTPRDGGNARRNTTLSRVRNGFRIKGNYDYSGVIDRGEYPNPPIEGTGKTRGGYSTQAPKGMVQPTIKFLDKAVKDFVKNKVNRR
jgi:hypothetical protein